MNVICENWKIWVSWFVIINIIRPSLGGRVKRCTRPSVVRPSVRSSVRPSHASDFLGAGKTQKLTIYWKHGADKSNRRSKKKVQRSLGTKVWKVFSGSIWVKPRWKRPSAHSTHTVEYRYISLAEMLRYFFWGGDSISVCHLAVQLLVNNVLSLLIDI